jgi:hypothetical protein
MNAICGRPGRLIPAGVMTALLGCCLIGARVEAASTASTTYQGQASIVVITNSNSLPGGSLLLCDTGPLPSTGGSLEQTVSNVNVANGGLVIAMARATTVGDGPQTLSDTAMTGFSVELMPPNGGMSLVTADFVGSTATATCDKNGKASVSASVNIQNLVVNGQAVTVTGAANQVVPFPGGRIVINEQASDVTNGSGVITVTALHVIEDGCLNGLFGFAQAGITCPSTPPPPSSACGKLTGGGWITGTPSGDKGTFGVSGGIKDGAFWGHLEYIDHDTGMNVHSTAVTGFTIDPATPNCATITYNVDINGVSGGTATVVACDNDDTGHGEQGPKDTFSISVSNGYSAGGDLGGSDPGGGTIQMHKCPPGWMK